MSVFCIPLDAATEQFYRSVARAAGLPLEQVLHDALFKLAGELSLEALARSNSGTKRKCQVFNAKKVEIFL